MISALLISALTVCAEPPALETGWRWMYGPQTMREAYFRHGYTRLIDDNIVMVDAGPEKSVIVRHVYPSQPGVIGAAATTYAVHLTTRDGERAKSQGWSSSSNESYTTRRESFNVDPALVESIGLAVLDLEGKRARSAEAAKAAAAMGATALPLPVIGEPFRFDLPSFEGDRIRSEDLAGKVVLIDHWATWCMPCMEKMPELRRVAAEYADDGLVVIGVNFDQDPIIADKAIDEGDMPWLHVHAPSTAAGYDGDLWEDLTGVTTLPRLLLIDRRGVLVDDFYPHKDALADKIGELLDAPDG